MSYSPVSHKRPYVYDSPVSNPSSEYTTYPSGYSCPPSHPSMHNTNRSNPPSGPHLTRSFPHIYSGTSSSFPPPQGPPSESYNYQYSSAPSQQYPVTSSRPFEDMVGNPRGYPPTFPSKESVHISEPQFHLSSNHYIEISNRCDEIIGILSKFDRSDVDNTNQLVDSAKALYDVFLTAEQRVSPDQSPVPSKSSEKPKKRTKSNQVKLYCHSCNCTDTPEWRKGPLGPRTLCNACGLIWAKLSKKKAKEAQMTAKNGKPEVEKDSRSNNIGTPHNFTTINNSEVAQSKSMNDIQSQPGEPTVESRDGKIDDKKLTLSFLLS